MKAIALSLLLASLSPMVAVAAPPPAQAEAVRGEPVPAPPSPAREAVAAKEFAHEGAGSEDQEFPHWNALTSLNDDNKLPISVYLRTLGCRELIDRSLSNNDWAISSSLDRNNFIQATLLNIRSSLKLLIEGDSLHPKVLEQLENAQDLEEKALATNHPAEKIGFMRQASARLELAKDLIPDHLR